MLNITPGTVLEERYKILRRLGQGGMGAVYLAHDRRLDRPCAIKLARHTGPGAEDQFRREAGFLAGLHHPNLPRVIDYFAQDDRHFLVMDYVEGQDFDEIVRRQGPVPESRVLRWLPQILGALEYLHNQQPQPIIHRDVKPANLKLTPDGQVVLVDFGIAKRYHPRRSTQVGAQAVSPGFSSPEQYGRRRTDARSDIYGVGATLYYLLTGTAPAESLDRLSGTEELVPPRRRNPKISPRTERVILKAMALNRDERFASVGEMRAALPAPEVTTPVSRRSQRNWLVPLVALFLILLVAGLGAFGAWRLVSARVPNGSRDQVAQAPATSAATAAATETRPAPTDQPTPSPALSPTAQPAVAEEPTREPTATLRLSGVPEAEPPVALYPAPELISPAANDSLIGPVVFRWTWDSTLKEDEFFALRVWRLDKPEVTVGETRELSYRLSHPPDGAGKYQWRVVITQRLNTGTRTTVSEMPAPVVLDFWRESEPITPTPAPPMQVPEPTTPVPEPTITPKPITQSPRVPRLVLGNYFAWFDGDKWGDCNISAGDRPLQPYSSDDPATIARHINLAEGVGLDGFTQHWFAPGERTDNNFNTLLAQSQGHDFHSTIVFSRHIWPGSPAPTKQNVAEAVRYVIDKYGGHPNFLRLQGKPVIFFTDMYRVPTEGDQSPQQAWADIRAQVDPNGNTWWIAEGLDPSYLSVFDGLYVYKITHADYPNDYVKASRWGNQVRQWEQRTGETKLWIGTLSPGWDDTRAGCKPDVRVPSKPHKRDREDGAFYQATFNAAVDSNPDWLWIHSFNEWVEGTYIEPSVLYGDKYMNMTREFTREFKQ